MFEELKEHVDKKLYDQPKRSYLWAVYLPDLTTPPEGLESDAGSASDIEEDFGISAESHTDLLHRITSVSLPFIEFDSETHPHHNKKVSYVSGYGINSDLSLDVIDTDDNLALRYFNAWKNLIKNEDGTFNPPSFYKRNLVYRHLSPSMETLINIKYKGVFPTQISDLTLKYESNELVTLTVSLKCDQLELADYEEMAVDKEAAYDLGLTDEEIQEYFFKVADLGLTMQQNLAQLIIGKGVKISGLPL